MSKDKKSSGAEAIACMVLSTEDAKMEILANSVGSLNQPPTNGPTNFAGSITTQIVGVTQSGSGTGLSATATTHAAVAATITDPSNTAVYGLASNTFAGSSAAGLTGAANTQLGPGVQGITTSSWATALEHLVGELGQCLCP